MGSGFNDDPLWLIFGVAAYIKETGDTSILSDKNIVLSTNHSSLPGFTVCHSVDELLDTLTGEENVFIIGGASIYKQLLPYCDTVYVTKLQTSVQSDVFFTNLDENDEWQLSETLLTGSENGISYSMVKYIRTIQKKTPH